MKKYPRKKQDDHRILPEEALEIFLFMKRMMNERFRSKVKGHHQRKPRLVLSKPKRTLSHICALIVIEIRIVNHVSERR